MKALVQQEHEPRHVLDNQFVAAASWRKLLDLADEDHQLSRTAHRRQRGCKRLCAPLFDRGFVDGSERLWHE